MADHSFSAITITRTAVAEEPGEIIYVNGAFEDLTGYQAEQMIGQTPGVLQGPKTEQEVISRRPEDRRRRGFPWTGDELPEGRLRVQDGVEGDPRR